MVTHGEGVQSLRAVKLEDVMLLGLAPADDPEQRIAVVLHLIKGLDVLVGQKKGNAVSLLVLHTTRRSGQQVVLWTQGTMLIPVTLQQEGTMDGASNRRVPWMVLVTGGYRGWC